MIWDSLRPSGVLDAEPCSAFDTQVRGTIARITNYKAPRSMKRTVVWLTNSQVKALTAMSKKSLAPLSALVRQAEKEFLQDKRKVRGSKPTESGFNRAKTVNF